MLALLVSELGGGQAHRREDLWMCQEEGGQGDRKNVWWAAPRIMEERGMGGHKK